MSGPEFVYQRALYYPSFDIRNAEWLAAASLYQENIALIVPGEIRTPTWGDSFALELHNSEPTFFDRIWIGPHDPHVTWAGERLLEAIDQSGPDDPSLDSERSLQLLAAELPIATRTGRNPWSARPLRSLDRDSSRCPIVGSLRRDSCVARVDRARLRRGSRSRQRRARMGDSHDPFCRFSHA